LTPGLQLEGEALQGPGLGQLGAFQSCRERGLLTGLPFGAQQLGKQRGQRCALALSGAQIFI